MMDLLVQVAAGNKLSPASHTIHIFDEETGRPVDYKASQSVGSLRVSTLHLVSKKQERKAERPRVAQPFEVWTIVYCIYVIRPSINESKKREKKLTVVHPTGQSAGTRFLDKFNIGVIHG